jgi:hypothetical protein
MFFKEKKISYASFDPSASLRAGAFAMLTYSASE